MVTGFLFPMLMELVMGKGYLRLHTWPMGVGVVIGAALVYLLSERLDRGDGRVLIDPATGQRVVLRQRHTLFWIPLRWVAAIVAVIGLVLLIIPSPASSRRNDGITPSTNTMLRLQQVVHRA